MHVQMLLFDEVINENNSHGNKAHQESICVKEWLSWFCKYFFEDLHYIAEVVNTEEYPSEIDDCKCYNYSNNVGSSAI